MSPLARLPVRLALLVAGMALVACALFVQRAAPQLRFRREYQRMERLLDTFAARRPERVSERMWGAAMQRTGIAAANVCFSTQHVPLPEMEKFVDAPAGVARVVCG